MGVGAHVSCTTCIPNGGMTLLTMLIPTAGNGWLGVLVAPIRNFITSCGYPVLAPRRTEREGEEKKKERKEKKKGLLYREMWILYYQPRFRAEDE